VEVRVARGNNVRNREHADARKREQAREGALAMQEYEAQLKAIRERTARLRALRLAKLSDKQQP
jgi:hypothetical protein